MRGAKIGLKTLKRKRREGKVSKNRHGATGKGAFIRLILLYSKGLHIMMLYLDTCSAKATDEPVLLRQYQPQLKHYVKISPHRTLRNAEMMSYTSDTSDTSD